MAATITEEAVARALRDIPMSSGDQEGLADFLTDYFGDNEPDQLGKQMNKLKKFITAKYL